jgi:glycosyltransferase involved in cell wall biosynthesis
MKSITIAGRNDDRLNVLEIIGSSGLGGMENYIKNFVANLPTDQFQITCIVPNESPFTDSLRNLGVKDVFIAPIEDDPLWRSIQMAIEVAHLHQIDVLHAHMPKAHVLAGLAGSLIRKPVVATIHGMNVTSHELGITRAVGSHLTTNCQEAYTQALAMGVPSDRVDLVRNGVDIEIFSPGRSNNKFRKSINVPEKTPLIGFVGRLEYEKGPDLFLRAAEYVHHIRPEAHFVIVGEGFMHPKLEEMCKQMRIDDHVHFTSWCTNTSEIYPSLDLLAHTSRSDGTSLVLLEAMACGCPTVGLAVGGVREIIENENTGFIVGPGDWEGLGIRIVQLLEQPDRLQSMRIAARSRVEKHFNVATNNRLTAEILCKVAYGQDILKLTNNSMVSAEVGGMASSDRF